jgi:hypothetical protein
MTDLRDHPYITTFSGARFRYDVPGPFLLEDVAHSLSLTVRFRGHTVEPYYVAQHCVLVALEMEACREAQSAVLAGLLHDAHEAYVGDVPSPLKWACPEFKTVENRVEIALRAALAPRVYVGAWGRVKEYDLRLLHREAVSLFSTPPDWAHDDGIRIEPWSHTLASRRFLDLARRLGLK